MRRATRATYWISIIVFLILPLELYAQVIPTPFYGTWGPIGAAGPHGCNEQDATSTYHDVLHITASGLKRFIVRCSAERIEFNRNDKSYAILLDCQGDGIQWSETENWRIDQKNPNRLIRGERMELYRNCLSSHIDYRSGRKPDRSMATFIICGSWNCRRTASEVFNPDTDAAWAIGRSTIEDAEDTCGRSRALSKTNVEYFDCIHAALNKPPVVIFANCTLGMAGTGEAVFQLSVEAKRGKLPNASRREFWETPTSHRGRSTAITWFNVLCPKASAKWNIREE